jgi:cysteinyl-tRNA synthetase
VPQLQQCITKALDNRGMTNPPSTHSAQILSDAVDKTAHIQEELQDAAHALNETNAVLSDPLSAAQAVSALAGAVQQNIAAETKVQDAAHELENVKELIVDAQIAQAAGQRERQAGEGTASILAYFEGRRAQARDDDARAEADK